MIQSTYASHLVWLHRDPVEEYELDLHMPDPASLKRIKSQF